MIYLLKLFALGLCSMLVATSGVTAFAGIFSGSYSKGNPVTSTSKEG